MFCKTLDQYLESLTSIRIDSLVRQHRIHALKSLGLGKVAWKISKVAYL